MKIVIFEDSHCTNLYPLGLFCPLYEVSIGSWTLHSMVNLLDVPVLTAVRKHLQFNNVEKNITEAIGNDPILFLNASIEPGVCYLEILKDIIKSGDPFISTSGNRVSAALIPPEKRLPENISTLEISPHLLEMELPLEREMFKTIDWPHESVGSHLKLFSSNIEKVISTGNYQEKQPGVFTGENVTLAPTAVIETRDGPVIIDSGVNIMHFTYLEGPIHIGSNSTIIEHSSLKDQTSIGPRCKIGGEIEASTIDSLSNKQHHGFLGHSWVGKWVNLGAGTSSSDLKNTYGKIRVEYNGNKFETGMQFIGSVIGDYAKTAVNTSLFTGKIVGVCSMIYGTVTTNVPSFSNYARSFGQVTEISIEQIMKTQARMFLRRDVKQTERDRALMKSVFELTLHERTISEEQINF
ncbi:MAG: glucose-1-phosphate thymidylyltransferase [Candidatus Latescibacteria bacterium]|jgi:UDP-N-acetylglucosamine diphosphorylase / glucose-1-phosphate thymidylyltransferase / UDP-N-acetylgalactosamine diphosphorylase / glucosamine-1-phosphate N-acetyltransferase / galactosamine-1-phosphate N-acetyltransferase|nr:glucose-1-phosphate thymidylyltransferase [Candidatus Latescibacterota bacterium]